MTIYPLRTYQTEDGNILKLGLSQNQEKYFYLENDKLACHITRFPLPWNTDLPGLNAESLFFTLRKPKPGRQGLNEAIAQVKEGKSWVVERTIEVNQLKVDDPEAFKPGVKTLDHLFNQLVSPYYHLVIYQEDPQDLIHVTFIVKGLLSHWISREGWMILYNALGIATNNNLPEHLTLSQWQWLYTMEVQHLFQSFLFNFEREETRDKSLNHLTPISLRDETKFSLFKDGVMDTLFSHLLVGYPLDAALWAALPLA